MLSPQDRARPRATTRARAVCCSAAFCGFAPLLFPVSPHQNRTSTRRPSAAIPQAASRASFLSFARFAAQPTSRPPHARHALRTPRNTQPREPRAKGALLLCPARRSGLLSLGNPLPLLAENGFYKRPGLCRCCTRRWMDGWMGGWVGK